MSTLDLGGAGSGNFGHAGRPGEVGGSSGDGGGASREPSPAPASHVVEAPTPEHALGTTRPEPHKVSELGQAVDLILKGEVVELTDIGTVHTVLSKLAEMAIDAEKKGEKAPTYDLCKVSVAGTNLFCGSSVKTAEHPDGIPRVAMPQFTGKALPGTKADALPKSAKGNVNTIPAFLEHLKDADIGVTNDRVPAAGLKATQADMEGHIVGAMMANEQYDPGEEAIFVSSDGYVVDGHHRWAAVVGRDAKDGKLGQSMMNVRRVDAPISELLIRAKTFATMMGMEVKTVNKKTALAMIFDGDLILLPFREKLMKLSEQWDGEDDSVHMGTSGG